MNTKKLKFLTVAAVVAMSLGLAGCGGGGGTAAAPEPEPTPYEQAVAGIAAATTAEAAQAAYDAVKDDVTAAQGARLQAAVDARIAALAMMGRAAEQKMALMDAAGNIDTSDLSTAEAIAAANTAIAALQAALDAAADVSDADKATYQTQLETAQMAVATAQGNLDTAGRMMAQRMALSDAVTATRTAVGMVDDEATDAEVMAADNAIAALRMAIDGAVDLPAGDADVASAQGTLTTLEGVLAAAKASRTAAMEAAAEAERVAAINAAKDMLTEKEAALAALGDDATDEDRRDALRMVEAAANALRDVLRMRGGSDADIEAAIRRSATAKVAADALQATITAAANAAERMRMAAINAAEMTLSAAETALSELGEDATDKETRDAHRAVERAAANLIQVLEANDGTAEQIEAATMKRDSAKTMADALTSPIEIADQRTAITDALDDLATAVAAVNDDASDDVVSTADKALADAKQAIADATELPEAETTAHGLVVGVHERALTAAKTSRTAAIAAKKEEQRKIAAAAVTKEAGTKLKAMNAEADPARTADEGLGGHANDAADNVAYALAISRDRTSTEVKVTDPALNNKADPKFVDQMAGLDSGRFMLVRTKAADDDGNVEEEVVVVGTDIKGPRAVAFAKVAGQALNARDLDPGTDADGDGNVANDFTALTLVAGTDDVNLPKIKSASFPTTGDATTLTFAFDSDTTTTVDEAAEFAGTYNGAMGTYRCDADAAECTVTMAEDPEDATKRIITAISAGWIFTPNAGVTSDVPDASYLHYGFWLKKTTDEDGVLTYNEVETFAGASTGLPASGGLATAGAEVRGTASYDGDAVGVYVHHVLSEGGGKIESSTAGHFKADASLTATFGQVHEGDDPTDTSEPGTIAPNLLNSVTGTIDNFTLSGGEAQDWSVNLARAPITTADGTASGMAEGGGLSGSYSATFHGSVADDADDTTPIPQPSAVVGEFNANMSNGSVAGAFGANKNE